MAINPPPRLPCLKGGKVWERRLIKNEIFRLSEFINMPRVIEISPFYVAKKQRQQKI